MTHEDLNTAHQHPVLTEAQGILVQMRLLGASSEDIAIVLRWIRGELGGLCPDNIVHLRTWWDDFKAQRSKGHWS